MKAKHVGIAGALVAVAVIAAMQVAPAQDDARRPRAQRTVRGGGEFGGRGGGFGGGYGGQGFGGGFGGGYGADGEAPRFVAGEVIGTPTVVRHWVGDKAELAAAEAIRGRLNEDLGDEGLDFVGTPLEEVLALLGERHHFVFAFNDRALEEFGIDSTEQINASVRGVTVKTALDRLLEPLDLTTVVEGGVLLVTTVDDAASRLTLAVYPVRDLTRNGQSQELVELIRATVGAGAWVTEGGEAEIRYFGARGCLVVNQSQPAHTELGHLLETLREVGAKGKANQQPEARARAATTEWGAPGSDQADDPFAN